jgi:murein DD-endopeptidase MepM/ murein hydrolase activator NlpD
MPNAPREYRAGIHEGIDFYTGYNCVEVPAGSPVLAAGSGTVIRADHDYVPLNPEELDELLTRSVNQGYTDAEALDRFRGMQVWVDHGDGVVTRYCHLSGIPAGITAGTTVSTGDVVGFVGDSGTPESVTAPGVEIHLHFEVRVGDSFLGAGLPPDQVRFLYEQLFHGN